MIKRKQQQASCPSGESGFTIIESLVALLVAAILLSAIAPVIILSAATRVQARRVELATQAARAYIDGLRTGAITLPSKPIELDPPSDPPSKDKPRKLEDNLINTTNMPVPTKSDDLYCFKKDGTISNPTCTSDLFYIQAAQIKVKNRQPSEGYRLGIRIYRANVDFSKTLTASGDGNNTDEKQKKQTQKTFTGGLGDRQAPLIEMTTDISSKTTTFKALCERLGSANNGKCN